jgi:hypothetical protein
MTATVNGLVRDHAGVARRLLADADRQGLAQNQAIDDGSGRRWLPQSLSRGAAGIALAHLVHADLGAADRWLGTAVAGGLTVGDGSGLWTGAPAVAFAAACQPGRYRTALARLDTAIGDLVTTRLDAAAARIAARQRPPRAEYDLVHGLTGLGSYLLTRTPDGQQLRNVLAYLVRLTEPVAADDGAGTRLPGWWTGDAPSISSPIRGHGNLGMAHGITGPLALLALAARRNITVAGQAEAIDRILHWLGTWQQTSPAGPWWPRHLSLDDVHTGQPTQPGPARPSWCYGTPGISRALQLAAIARGDRARQHAAEQALARCVTDPAQLAELVDPFLCHGWAGVTATVHQAAADALTADLAAALPGLTGALLHHSKSDADQPPGLITGTAGIAVTLHTVAAGSTSPWPACLLIN